MKRVIFPFLGIVTILMAGGFTLNVKAAEDVRKLDPFDGVGISISADVYYVQGNTHEIRIEGNEGDVEDLITEVSDGFLQVKYEDWRTHRSKLTIYVTSKELEAVKVSGSGHFWVEKTLSPREMELAMSGSGQIFFSELNTKEVDVKISGSGSISIEGGNGQELDAKISGSGRLMAERFEVSEFTAAISGSGNIKITCKDGLDAKISGSGSVYYHGDPKINSVSSGSGKVVSL